MKKVFTAGALALVAVHASAALVCEPTGPDGHWAPSSSSGSAPTAAQIQECKDLAAPLEALKRAQEAVREAKVKAQEQEAKAAATPSWTLTKGGSVSSGLREWAQQAGWTLVWDMPKDWVVPNGVVFQGDFASAASQVIEALSKNGADVRADVYAANKTFVVHQAGGSN